MSTKQRTESKKQPISLMDFMMKKKREGCPVCALPLEVHTQMVEARKRKFKRGEVLEWLAAAHRIKITPADLDRHFSGRHEQ